MCGKSCSMDAPYIVSLPCRLNPVRASHLHSWVRRPGLPCRRLTIGQPLIHRLRNEGVGATMTAYTNRHSSEAGVITVPSSDFAQTIRGYRVRAGLSQEELAERAGVSTRAVSDMERGLRRNPRPETLRLLADALALEPEGRAHFFASAY